jgi:hypothetical protein
VSDPLIPRLRAVRETLLIAREFQALTDAIVEIETLRAAVRDAYMTLDNFGIGTEWELRHAAVLARAAEAEHG